MSNAKINSINMFINKFENNFEVIDIDSVKESFLLDEGETGFYKLSLYQKKTFGTETVNDNYNRPAIGPINKGLYCSYCGQEGPKDHLTTCDFPDDNSLNLTLEGINNYIIIPDDYKGDYLNFKKKFLNKTLNQKDLNEILLNPDEIIVTNGSFDISLNKNVLSNVSFLGIYKKRGPQKLASKTSTTQFLNNIIIAYEKFNTKTSIRISKNGLINLINVPIDGNELKKLIDDLILRLNNTNAINMTNFNLASGENNSEYKMIKNFSYIHSVTGQFKIDSILKDNEINYEELNNIISPYDSSGDIVSGDYTTIEKTQDGNNIINFGNIKIIEWEYSLGRLTRGEVMTKEYIKSVSIPTSGIKLTSIFNKYGTVVMTLSRCSNKQMLKGLCGSSINNITPELFEPFIKKINDLFEKEKKILVKKSLGSDFDKNLSEYNTVSGYAPSGKICRLTRTRESGDSTYKEGMRPEPYTWAGKCPDPNYQYLKPEGVQDSNGLWYPCCEAKTKESVEKMKKYLLNGFPLNKSQAESFNIIDGEDFGSGIIKPGSNSIGASAEVYINGTLEVVTIMKKLSKKSNEYVVKMQNGKSVTIKGTDFKRESRIFPGIKDLKREKLLECVIKNLKMNNNVINKDGKIIKDDTSEFNEKFVSDKYEFFLDLVGEINKKQLTYYNISQFKFEEYFLFKTPIDSYAFYLILSPKGNFYISETYKFLISDISENFTDTIVLFGYLNFNEIEFKKQFNVMDLVYLNKKIEDDFNIRFIKLLELQTSILNTIMDEIIVIQDYTRDIIAGSYDVKKSEKLIFISNTCCELVTWGDKDMFEDIIQLQILSINRQSIKFGYENKTLPDDIGISFLSNFTFNKRDIPEDIKIGDYYNIKINRTVDGKIVPNRKVSIYDRSGPILSYDKTMEILTLKFSPIKSDFFQDPDRWYLLKEILVFDNGILKII